MDIKMIRAVARERVENAKYSARKLALLSVGATVAVGFLLTLVGFLLEKQMESHVGLGGLEIRTFLSLIQTVLMIGGTAAIPFWNLGYTGAALKTARGEVAEPKALLAGFRVFFPALRLFLLQMAVIMAVCLVGMQVGTILYMLSPASDGAMIFLEQMMQDATVIDEAMAMRILKLMWPMYVLIGVVILGLLIPIVYRLRLVEFSLMDGEERALLNMANSYRKMRGNCLSFFRLDLSFWWYYLLQALAATLAYGDVFFGNNPVAYWGFYIASCGAQLAVGYCCLPRVMTTYAAAYDEITKEKEQVI